MKVQRITAKGTKLDLATDTSSIRTIGRTLPGIEPPEVFLEFSHTHRAGEKIVLTLTADDLELLTKEMGG